MSFSIESLLGFKKTIKENEDSRDVYSTNFIPAKCFSWKHMESVIKKTEEWSPEQSRKRHSTESLIYKDEKGITFVITLFFSVLP